MSVSMEWFKPGPKTEVYVDITSGSLTLTSSSRLVNPTDYLWNPDQVVGAIYKNGSSAAALTINSSTGAITAGAVSVAQNDVIEIRVEFTGPDSWPWHNKMIARRSAFLTVPAGNQTYSFDDSNNKQPVPAFDLAYGWDSDNKLKVGFKIGSADGASQSMTVYTRRLPTAQESSSSISLSNTSTVQNHTSTFTNADITGDFEIEWVLPSASTNPKQEDRVRLVFHTKGLVALSPADFPGSDVSLVQSRVSAKLKLGAPGQ